MHISCAAKPQRMGIGLDTLTQVTDAIDTIKGGATGDTGGGVTGGGGGSVSPSSSATTVSPTIQTQISPQISPVFQQTGSGSQTASTSMIAPGGQSGKGGDAIPSAPFLDQPAPQTPYFPGTGSPTAGQYTPQTQNLYNDPFYPGFDISRYVPQGSTAGQMIEQQKKGEWIKWPVIALGVGAVGMLAYTFMNKPKTS